MAKRDAAPLRLISWLAFQLDPLVQALIDSLMLHLSTSEVVVAQEILDIGRRHLKGTDVAFSNLDELRDALLSLPWSVSATSSTNLKPPVLTFLDVHATYLTSTTCTLF